MIFTVRDLGFEIGPFLLEGWWALAARAVCAAVIVFAGLLVGWLLRRKIFPASAGPQLALCRHAHPPAQLTEPFGADGLLQRPVPGLDQPAVGHSGPDKVSVHGL